MKLQDYIINFIDIFYPMFKQFMDKRKYHYLVCGGSNTVFGLVMYYYADHFLVQKHDFYLGFITLKPHIASLAFSIITSFPTGFLMNRFIVWHDSTLSTFKQLYRHFSFVILFSIINYILLKLFVEVFGWWDFPSQFFTTCIIVVFSYLSQKHISFKKSKK